MRTKSEHTAAGRDALFEEEGLARRRRRPRTETARQRTIAACAAHLRDLRRVHRAPPADVAVKSVAIPARLSGVEQASYCASPAAMCAELAQ